MLHILLLVTLAQLTASTFDPELHAKYLEMPQDQFIEYFNSQNYTWKLSHNPHLKDNHQSCLKVNYTRRTELKPKRYNPQVYYEQLPENFDAREKWANCDTIQDIFDQGNCGSCWAFATATVASDRMCISKGLTVRLSEQDFDCIYPICKGGHPDDSFPYWRDVGVVSLECRPYDIHASKFCVKKCNKPSTDYQNDKHFAESIYQISDDEDEIKAELFHNGPIFAGFTVYEDFRNYKTGVYVHQFGEESGGHAVRIIGYGVENGVDYWLVANSWGPEWGDKGLFKIKRYQDLKISFESMLYAGAARN